MTLSVTVTINTTTQAFGAEPQKEVGRILRRIADRIDTGFPLNPMSLKDSEGFNVGLMQVEERPHD